MTWIPETMIRALCWTLLHSLWQGLILAVVAGVVMVLTKRAKSATRYTVLSILVAAFLLVSGYTFVREWRVPAGAPVQAVIMQPTVPAPQILQAASQQVTAPHQLTVMGQLVDYFNSHAAVVVLVWFIVFLARFVNLLSGLVYAQRIRHYQTSAVGAEWQERLGAMLARLRIRRPVVLLESALIKVPVVVGWLKPAILVPIGMLAQLPPEQVESILLHELAHIGRRDYLFNILQQLIDTLYFFNPALLWVSSLIRQERENCCDDVAIRETRSRRKLVQALVSFHEYQQSSGYALGFAGQRNSLLKRVERIVHKKNHSLNTGERALLMGGVMVLCGAFMTINGNTGRAEVTMAKHAHVAEVKKAIHAEKLAVRHQATETRPALAVRAHVHARLAMTVEVPVRIAERLDTTPPAASGKASSAGTANWPESGTMTSADVDKIIQAHEHGVTPEFLASLKSAGYSVSIDEAIRLKDHGVTLEFLAGLKQAGYNFTPDDAVKLVDHGVTLEFLQGLGKEGYAHVSLAEATRLIDHGVTIEFIQRIRALGYPDLTTGQAVMLADHGVTPDFIEKWKKKTGSKLDLRDYVRLQEAGVQPD